MLPISLTLLTISLRSPQLYSPTYNNTVDSLTTNINTLTIKP